MNKIYLLFWDQNLFQHISTKTGLKYFTDNLFYNKLASQ